MGLPFKACKSFLYHFVQTTSPQQLQQTKGRTHEGQTGLGNGLDLADDVLVLTLAQVYLTRLVILIYIFLQQLLQQTKNSKNEGWDGLAGLCGLVDGSSSWGTTAKILDATKCGSDSGPG